MFVTKDVNESSRRLCERQTAFQVTAPIDAATNKTQELKGKNPQDPKPVVLTLIGDSNSSKTFLLNTILRTTTPLAQIKQTYASDPINRTRNRKELEIPFKVHKTKTVSIAFYRNLNEYVSGWVENEVRLQSEDCNENLDPKHSYLLPETLELKPTIKVKYGSTPRMFVTYPTVQSLQQSIFSIICLKLPTKSNADRIRQEYLTKFTNNKKSLSLIKKIRNWEHIKIKEEILTSGLLGNTIQYKALGEDFNGSDRYFVRESLKEILSGIGCFAECITIQIPSPLLKDNIEFNISDSDCFFPRDRELCVSNIDRSDIVVVTSLRGKKILSNATCNLLSMAKNFLNNLQDYPDHKLIISPIFNKRMSVEDSKKFSLNSEEISLYRDELINFFSSQKISYEKIQERVQIFPMNVLSYLKMCRIDDCRISQPVGVDDREIKKKQSNIPRFLNILKTITILHCAEPLRAGLHIWMRRQRHQFDFFAVDNKISLFLTGIEKRIEGLSKMADKFQLEQFTMLQAGSNIQHVNREFNIFKSNIRRIPDVSQPNFGTKYANRLEKDVLQLTCGHLLRNCHSWWISTVLSDIPDTFKVFAELSGEIIRECRLGLETRESNLLEKQYFRNILDFWDGPNENQLPSIIKEFKSVIYEKADVIVSNSCLTAVQHQITPTVIFSNTVDDYLCDLQALFSAVSVHSAKIITTEYKKQLKEAACQLLRLKNGIKELQESVHGQITTIPISQTIQILNQKHKDMHYGAMSQRSNFIHDLKNNLKLDLIIVPKSTQFSAVAHQIYYTDTAHKTVRLLTLHEILRNSKEYLPHIKMDFSDYIAKMMNDDELGDHCTIHAIANAFLVNILLFSPFFPKNPIKISSREKAISEIRIAYTNKNEYCSLIPCGTAPNYKSSSSAASSSSNTENKNNSNGNSSDNNKNVINKRFSDHITKDSKISKKRSNSSILANTKSRYQFGSKIIISSLTRMCILKIVSSLQLLPILDGALPEELVQPIIREIIAQNKLDGIVLQKLLHQHILRLDLSNSRITNVDLADVSSFCPYLHEISLANCCNISTEGIGILARTCSELRTINLERCNIDGGAISALLQCKHLISVNLTGCTKISPSEMKEILRIPTIQNLSFKNCTQVTEDVFEQLSEKLQQLDISECDKITDTAVLKIAANNTCNLKSFKISGKLITDRSISQFVNTFPKLEHLELNGCDQISDITVRCLAACKQLTILDLSSCGYITPGAFTPSPDLTLSNLKQLNLSCCKNISDETIFHISKCSPQLSVLNLSSCEEITDSGLIHISEFHLLRELNVSMCTKISDRSISRIAHKCPKLVHLVFSRCRITDQAVHSLALHCRDIEHLDISACENINGDCFSQFTEGFPKLKILKINDLRNLNNLPSISGCSELEELHASRCISLNSKVLLKIAGGCSLIHTIDLSHLDNLTVFDIQSAISMLPSLRCLRIRNYSKFNDVGFSHNHLEELTIPWSSSFNDECLKYVASNCPRLQNIDLAWCSSVTEGSVELLIEKCPISSINIRGTKVTSSAASFFATSCSVRY